MAKKLKTQSLSTFTLPRQARKTPQTPPTPTYRPPSPETIGARYAFGGCMGGCQFLALLIALILGGCIIISAPACFMKAGSTEYEDLDESPKKTKPKTKKQKPKNKTKKKQEHNTVYTFGVQDTITA